MGDCIRMDGVVQELSLALTLGRQGVAGPELQANTEEQQPRNLEAEEELGRIHRRLNAFRVYPLDEEVEESLLGVCT